MYLFAASVFMINHSRFSVELPQRLNQTRSMRQPKRRDRAGNPELMLISEGSKQIAMIGGSERLLQTLRAVMRFGVLDVQSHWSTLLLNVFAFLTPALPPQLPHDTCRRFMLRAVMQVRRSHTLCDLGTLFTLDNGDVILALQVKPELGTVSQNIGQA